MNAPNELRDVAEYHAEVTALGPGRVREVGQLAPEIAGRWSFALQRDG
jgi:hypothetical protein